MADSPLRALPSVDRVAGALEAPHPAAVAAARRALAALRRRVGEGAEGRPIDPGDLLAEAVALAREELAPSLRPVLNATGVIVHTNLGRAPLAACAQAAVARIAGGYSTLELDLDTGHRGSRHTHVSRLLSELTGAEAGLVVNNGAGAVLLCVAALAARGAPVVISRGQLIEIGGGFRIPEVIEQAGCRLVEVGTTNRTRSSDYRCAIKALEEPQRAIIVRVHASNFRTVGFVEEVEIEELCGLGPPVVDDLGSGALAAGMPVLADEPDVRRSLRAGVTLACFSGDKLLGGPQAGVIVGSAEAVATAGRHPLARALRIDKLSLAALVATLELYRDPAAARREIPALAMLETGEAALQRRARALAAPLGSRAELARGTARVGGGALPLLELEGPVVCVNPAARGVEELAARLRSGDPVVLGRIREGRLVLDPRTLADPEAGRAGGLVARALDGLVGAL